MTLVSVIIPNYNHSLYLKQRIESVLNQTFDDYELIILDDCSSDDSREVINLYKSHPKVSHIIFNNENSGSTFKQWLKGINLSVGNLIWIAESDDFADKNFLKEMIIPFNDRKVGLVNCQSFRYDHENLISGTWQDHTQNITKHNWQSFFVENGKDFIRNAMLFQNSIPNASGVVFRKQLIVDNTIDIGMTLNGDWLFYIKLLTQSDIAFIPAPLNYFRFHNNKGSSGNIKNFNNIYEYYKIIKFIFDNIELSIETKKKVLLNVYRIWYNQCDQRLEVMFKSNFKKVYKIAAKVDRILFLRIAKDFLMQFKNKMFTYLKRLVA